MNPVADLTNASRGLALVLAGRPGAATHFDATRRGLIVASGWFALALLLSAAAQSAALGLPSLSQLALGFVIQGLSVAILAVTIAQTLRFLRLGASTLALLVPIIYGIALVQVLAIPLSLIGPNAQLVAVLGLAVLIWRMGVVIGAMRNGVALAFALLCLMVLVVVPNALYMLLLATPSPA